MDTEDGLKCVWLLVSCGMDRYKFYTSLFMRGHFCWALLLKGEASPRRSILGTMDWAMEDGIAMCSLKCINERSGYYCLLV